MARIVVGIDGSSAARVVLRFAIEECDRHGLPLTVVAVQPTPASAPAWGMPSVHPRSEDRELMRAAAQALIDETLAEVQVKPEVQLTVVQGVPADVILEQAGPDDRIVVGSRGIGGLRRAFLGSVSNDIVHSAHCPVTVVPTRR